MIKNLSLLADFYEFTMSQGYFENNLKDKTVVFPHPEGPIIERKSLSFK